MLRWSNVTSGYDRRPVIADAELTVKKGEILALIGLNGSGKTTLLKTALGLLKPSRGEVLLEDQPLRNYSLEQRAKKISLLESRGEPTFSMSVSELLELAARLHAKEEREKRVTLALTAVGLQDYKKKNLLQLSSGEVRRAMLAHTLCANAEIILLDEPFAHLDWHHQCELAESLLRWHETFNTTFVLAIHELEWAAKIADRICVLNSGRILACDQPVAIFQNHEVGEVFAFRAAIDENPIDGSKRLTLGYQPRN